jgi:hypothetical protein
VIAGITYWVIAETAIRLAGKEIVFSPVISVFLVVPFWPMMVYADFRWIGVLPQDVAAICVIPLVLLVLRFSIFWKH